MIEVALFVLSNVAAALAAEVVADRVMGGREPWRKILAWACGYSILAVLLVLVLGLLGILSAVTITVAAILIYVGLLARYRRWGGRRTQGFTPQDKPGSGSLTSPLEWYVAVGLLVGSAGWIAIGSLFGGTEFTTDDLIYHAPIVAHWVQEGGLSFAPAGYSAYYPQNAELFAAWFVLPFRADAYASLAGLYWVALAGLAVAVHCRLLGCRMPIALTAAAMFFSSGIVLWAVRTFSAVDLIGPAAVLAAIAFAVPSNKLKDTERDRMTDACYAGLLGGIAVGSKVPFASAVFVLLVYFWYARSGPTVWSRLRVSGVLILAAALTGSYWYVRNILLTGNPIYPAALGPLAGPFGPLEQSRTTLLYWLLNDWHNFETWSRVVRYLKWGYGLGVLSALGFIVAIYRSVRRRAEPRPFGLLLSIAAVSVLLFPAMPFSGTWDGPNQPLVEMPRYVILPFAIGLVLGAAFIAPSRFLFVFYALAVLACFENWWRVSSPSSSVLGHGALIAVGAVGAWAVYHKHDRRWLGYGARLGVPGVLLSFLAVLGVHADRKQASTDHNIHSYMKGVNHTAGASWKALGRVPGDAVVAAFGPDMWMYYPLFGRRYELRPHPGTINGDTYMHLHARPPEQRRWWWHERVKWEPNRFVEHLRSHGVQYILISKGNERSWPEQYDVLRALTTARAVYQDDHTTLWAIEKSDAQSARSLP